MNRDDLIRLSREAGVPLDFTMYRNGPIGSFTMDEFMKLMGAAYAEGQSAEREACAQVCEETDNDPHVVLHVGTVCAAAIRARGQSPAQTCCKGGPQWGHAWDCPTLP